MVQIEIWWKKKGFFSPSLGQELGNFAMVLNFGLIFLCVCNYVYLVKLGLNEKGNRFRVLI